MTSNANSISSTGGCDECGRHPPTAIGGCSFLGNNAFTACPREGCTKILCSKCSSLYPLIVFKKNEDEDSTKAAEGGQNDIRKSDVVQCFCRPCFEEMSTLDFGRDVDVIVPSSQKSQEDPVALDGRDDDGQSSCVTFVFVHGGSGSRKMFHGHASILAEKYGHRSILLDLPGHGAKADTALSLETCASTFESVIRDYRLIPGGRNVYVGGSLGAYVGFHLLDNFQQYFSSAILLDCGQNVGPGASMKAKAGLWFLNLVGSHLSNETMMKMMLSATRKSPADYKLIETSFGSGMFFNQAREQVTCLKAVAPADYLPRINIPILFMNGSEDYRDSEEKWLELSQKREACSLEVYEGGDHFFTHDTRFLDDMLQRWVDFAVKNVSKID